MTAARATVLVIDDEQDMREMLAFELSQDGFEVATAESGMAGVEAVKKRRFDLAVTDLKMPGMDGAQTVAALKEIEPDLEIIVATGYATVETAVDCMRRGAYDYIRKPYDLEEMRLLLERALERSRLQGSLALYEASRALLATLDHGDLVRLVVDLAARVLRAEAVGLLLQGDDGGVQRTVHTSGETKAPSNDLLDALARHAAQAGAALRVLCSEGSEGGEGGEPGEHSRCLHAEGFASALAYPLSVRGARLGTLLLFRRPATPCFAVSELGRGTVFAAQLAMAIDNARLYGALEDKIREVSASRERLVLTEKLALVGELAGGVAHEINNPLAVIQANLRMLGEHSTAVEALWSAAKSAAAYLRQVPDSSGPMLARRLLQAPGGNAERTDGLVREIAQIAGESLDAVRRIADLVEGFIHLAQPGSESAAERLDVGELIDECLAEVSRRPSASGHAIARELPGPLVTLVARKDMATALSHVLTFALDSAPAGSGAAISVRGTLERGRPLVCISLPHLTLSAEERAHVFDPRLDVDTRQGRRLRLDIRLSLAHELARRTGAELVAAAGADGSLVFRFQLPASDSSEG